MGAVDLGGHRLQAGLVAIGQCEIAAARRSSSASARPMPLAAPVTAAADPRIAVIEFQLHLGKDSGGARLAESI